MNIELLNIINKEIQNGSSILDVGCGSKEFSNPLKHKCKVITVDVWEKVNPDFLIDLEKNDLSIFKNNEFDYVFMIDFIEHLEKDRGYIILNECKRICNKKLFLLTPLWWSSNEENVNNKNLWCFGNTYDVHKSLWKIEDFENFERINISTLPNYFIGSWKKI